MKLSTINYHYEYMRGRILIATLTTILFGALPALAWTGPSQAAPNGNVSAPINVGATGQTKAGNLGVTGYLNFGATLGTTGYGMRDNAGTLEFKNSGGSWSSLQSTIFNLGGANWTTSGSNIYNANAGNVGVGTPSPSMRLDVEGGGAYNMGGVRIGSQTLNSNSNGWLYMGNSAGTVYGGQGLAVHQLYVEPGGCLYVNGVCFTVIHNFGGLYSLWWSDTYGARQGGNAFVGGGTGADIGLVGGAGCPSWAPTSRPVTPTNASYGIVKLTAAGAYGNVYACY